MRKFSRWVMSIAGTGIVVVGLAVTSQTTQAQAPGGFPGRPSISVQAFNACTTTDYTSIIAKALNTAPGDLRKNIVAGQTIQDMATTANVGIQDVVDAYTTARKADIDQAVKDGVITQDEGTALEATPPAPGARPTPNGTPRAPGQGGGGRGQGGGGNGQGGPGGAGFQIPAQFPDISTIRFLLAGPATPAAPGQGGGNRGGFGGGFGGFGGFGGIGAGTFNLVKQYVVAATALNMKCTDLVKELITPPGKMISAVATEQKVDPATVSAALTKAYKDALAQDVTDGVITQAQSDQLSPDVDKAVAAFVSNPYVMGRQGPPATPAQ